MHGVASGIGRLVLCCLAGSLSSDLWLIDDARAQTAAVFGSCNTINQNVTIGQNSTLIVENDCATDKPENSYRLRYVWLDSKNLSFVLGNYFDQALTKLLGNTP